MTAANHLFTGFQRSEDTVRIYLSDNLLFRSAEKGVRPLLTYLLEFHPCPEGVTVFDRIVGNAAALLLKKASCREIHSIIGSETAAETLKRLGIAHSFQTTVPFISNRAGDGMCPFEKASIGKSSDEFYKFALEATTSGRKG